MNSRQAFAANILRRRTALGLSQAQVAERAELTVQTISNYETGARWPQSPEVLDILAKALGVRPADLITQPGEAPLPAELLDHLEAAARVAGLKVSRA